MTPIDVHDAIVSVRVAADLCRIPIGRVLDLLTSKKIRSEKIKSKTYVNLKAVERAIEKEEQHDLFS
jgi:hypothetical protein